METDVLEKKDPTVSDMCRALAGWKNQYGNRYNPFSE